MELNLRTSTEADAAARAAAMSAGDLSLAVRGELTRLLAESGGDRQQALLAGLDLLVERNALTKSESGELAKIFDAIGGRGGDSDVSRTVRSYYRRLVLDPCSTPTALAITSVLNSLVSGAPVDTVGTNGAIARVSGGDGLFGGAGAVIGAGIGFGFGGPIGAGVGAVVGAAVGVCIEHS